MAKTHNDRLDSWKEIADYLHRDITTVIRWEKEKELPVHRVPGGKRHAVFAYPGEIDRWLQGGGSQRVSHSGVSSPESEARGQRSESDSPKSGVRSPEPEAISGQLTVLGQQEQATDRRVSQAVAASRPQAARMAALPVAVSPKRFWLAVLGVGAIGLLAALVLVLRSNSPPSFPRAIGYTQLTSDGRVKGGLATDGARLYFTEETAEGFTLVQMPTSGGAPTPISTPFKHPQILDINVTSGEILVAETTSAYSRPGRLWVVPLVGGAPRQVVGVSAFSAALSPDGKVIAYTEGRDLYFCRTDGSEARKVVSLPGPAGAVAWSPDASLLRLSILDANGGLRVWQVRADGSGLHVLLPAWEDPTKQSGGRWTPDGKYYLFLRQAEPSRNDIWVLRESQGLFRSGGPQASALTTGPLNCLGLPAPSFDGKRLFFIGAQQRAELMRYDVRAGQWVSYLPGISGSELDMSKDRQWIAYVGQPGESLWRSRKDGSERLQLAEPPMATELPRWSPDGRWIAFMGTEKPDAPAASWRVYVVSADGTGRRSVLESENGQGAPTWSPDSTRLIFGELVERPQHEPVVIHLVDLRTGEASVLPGSEGLWTARWSPDGRYIAALTQDSKNLMLFDFRSRKWSKLTTAGSIVDVCWSHQGDSIYFSDHLPSQRDSSIFRVRLRDGRVEPVASLRGTSERTWMGLDPDDSPLVTSLNGTEEVYALDWQLP